MLGHQIFYNNNKKSFKTLRKIYLKIKKLKKLHSSKNSRCCIPLKCSCFLDLLLLLFFFFEKIYKNRIQIFKLNTCTQWCSGGYTRMYGVYL